MPLAPVGENGRCRRHDSRPMLMLLSAVVLLSRYGTQSGNEKECARAAKRL
jgi:hypothetical protein